MPESAAQQFAKLQSLTPQEAVNYLQRRDRLTQTFSWQDLWHDEHAQRFTVSRLARLDLLKAMQDGITKSVQGDLTRRDWTRDIKGLLQKEGWWGEVDVLDPVSGEVVTTKFDSPRLKLIFDTNTRMANSAGLWDRVWRNRETHPYLLYITRGDERVRAAHRGWNYLCLPVDHPFWETHWPPNGWHCRCRVMSVTQAEYDRLAKAGKTITEAPPEEFITWTNKRTGETTQVPVGVSPGFDYNPGLAQARLNALQKVGLDKFDSAPAPMRRASMTPSVTEGVSESFAQSVTEAHAALPVNARRAVAAGGYQVQVVKRISETFPELLKRKPPGYPTAFDYRQVDGLTWHERGLVLIAEEMLDAESGLWIAGSERRAQALLRHETGHVLDELNDFVSNRDVVKAWQLEADALRLYLGKLDEVADYQISYFAGDAPRGIREVIAELYAIRNGSRTASDIDASLAFPDTMQILYRLLDEQGL